MKDYIVFLIPGFIHFSLQKMITFVLVRETRQLGDDEGKRKKVMIGSLESDNKPELIFWNKSIKRYEDIPKTFKRCS